MAKTKMESRRDRMATLFVIVFAFLFFFLSRYQIMKFISPIFFMIIFVLIGQEKIYRGVFFEPRKSKE